MAIGLRESPCNGKEIPPLGRGHLGQRNFFHCARSHIEWSQTTCNLHLQLTSWACLHNLLVRSNCVRAVISSHCASMPLRCSLIIFYLKISLYIAIEGIQTHSSMKERTDWVFNTFCKKPIYILNGIYVYLLLSSLNSVDCGLFGFNTIKFHIYHLAEFSVFPCFSCLFKLYSNSIYIIVARWCKCQIGLHLILEPVWAATFNQGYFGPSVVI